MSEELEISGENMSEAAAPVVNDSEAPLQPEHEARQVPLDALQAERAERQRLQDDLRMMKDHMALMQANQAQPAPKREDFDGLSEDDVLTVRDMKKALSQKEKEFESTIQEIRMTQKYSDYAEVVTQFLPEVLKQNPSLGNTLRTSQDYELAYHLSKNSDAYRSSHKTRKKNADAERIVQNATRAGSLSSVGQTSPINEARRYKDMTDDEFRNLSNRHLG